MVSSSHFLLPPFLFLSPSLLFSLPPSLLSFLHLFIFCLFHLNFWPREGTAGARSRFAAIGFLLEPLPVPAAVPNLIYPRIQFQGNNMLVPWDPSWRCFTPFPVIWEALLFFPKLQYRGAVEFLSLSWAGSEGRQPLLRTP